MKENNQRGQIITNIHGHARSRWNNNASIKYSIIKGESREISIQSYLKLQRCKFTSWITPIPITIRWVKEENFTPFRSRYRICKLCSKIDPQHLLRSISGALDLRALFPGSLRRALVLIFTKDLFSIFPYPAWFIKGCRDSGALTIYTNLPGGNLNIQCCSLSRHKMEKSQMIC